MLFNLIFCLHNKQQNDDIKWLYTILAYTDYAECFLEKTVTPYSKNRT